MLPSCRLHHGSCLDTLNPALGLTSWLVLQMVALGEMTTAYPIRGAFVHQATRFLDPSVGFALGWNYWYSWAIVSWPLSLSSGQTSS